MKNAHRRQARKPGAGQPQADRKAGSETRGSGTSEPEFLLVGRIVRPHGVRGEVNVKALTAYPEHLSTQTQLYVGARRQPFAVRRIRHRTEEMLIVQFEGVDDRNAAERLREEMVYVHIKDAVPLEEDEYYLYQIEGIRVVTDDGEELGQVTDVIETGRGFQIFLVEDIVVEGRREYEQVADEIEERLYQELEEKQFQSWLETLKENAHIKKML